MAWDRAHYNRDAQELLCPSHLNQASSCSNVALLLGSITPIVASTALTKKILSNFVFISKFSWYFELQLTSNMEIKIDKLQPMETRPVPSHWQFLEGLDVPSKTQKALSGHFICIPKIVASEYEIPQCLRAPYSMKITWGQNNQSHHFLIHIAKKTPEENKHQLWGHYLKSR